jgi:hypothetical protein
MLALYRSGRQADAVQTAAPIEQQFQALIAEHPEPLAIGLGLATSQLLRLFAGDLDGRSRTASR